MAKPKLRADCAECGGKYHSQGLCELHYRRKRADVINSRRRELYSANPERIKERARTWYRNNAEYALAQAREWALDNPEKVKNNQRKHRFKRFGITEEQYQQMVAEQDGVCKICLKPPKKIDLSIDHCHTTGRVRGLLCFPCNIMLGRIKESTETLQRAIDYLNAFKDQT